MRDWLLDMYYDLNDSLFAWLKGAKEFVIKSIPPVMSWVIPTALLGGLMYLNQEYWLSHKSPLLYWILNTIDTLNQKIPFLPFYCVGGKTKNLLPAEFVQDVTMQFMGNAMIFWILAVLLDLTRVFVRGIIRDFRSR